MKTFQEKWVLAVLLSLLIGGRGECKILWNHPNGYGVDERGFWVGEASAEQHLFDRSLAQELIRFFWNENAQSVVDFGCGLAQYVQEVIRYGIRCEGYDGNPATPSMTNGLGQVIDLSQPFDLGKRYDWVLSLEVGEHIPQQFERIYIENLDRHNTKGIILSWALKGQGGFGHFNTQNNDYIKTIMSTYGYENDLEVENQLRRGSRFPWFRKTVMVFRKKS